jgi:hypothetical protein
MQHTTYKVQPAASAADVRQAPPHGLCCVLHGVCCMLYVAWCLLPCRRHSLSDALIYFHGSTGDVDRAQEVFQNIRTALAGKPPPPSSWAEMVRHTNNNA